MQTEAEHLELLEENLLSRKVPLHNMLGLNVVRLTPPHFSRWS